MAASMTYQDASPPPPPPFMLSAPSLDFTTPEPHPDSEECRQGDRHRTSRELEFIYEQSGSQRPQTTPHTSPNAPQARRSQRTRSRANSGRNSSYRSRTWSCPSEAPTAVDREGPDGHNDRRHRLRRQVVHWYDPVVKFWTTQVSVTIDEGHHRDHLALERTFLGYLRTSLALAMSGVIIAQLFRLQHANNPNMTLGFFVLGIPLAAIFIGFGMVVLLIGAFRFWRQQNAIIRGKVHAGGWEIISIMGFSIILCTATFILVTAIDIQKTFGL